MYRYNIYVTMSKILQIKDNQSNKNSLIYYEN